jgi:TRAP-type uncharacterized transport system substrate-binding protein
VRDVGQAAPANGHRIFRILRIELRKVLHIDYSNANGQLADGLLDVVAAWTGVPAPQFADLQASRKVSVLILDADEAVVAKMPYFAVGAIPAGSYNDQPQPITTLALCFIVNKDMPDDLVYELVKAPFGGRESMERV